MTRLPWLMAWLVIAFVLGALVCRITLTGELFCHPVETSASAESLFTNFAERLSEKSRRYVRRSPRER